MNRHERRAAKARARHHRIDPITAGHEAGHAVGRYLVAPDMGLPEDEIITDIVIHIDGARPAMGTSKEGRVKFESLAVCNGPMLTPELNALVPAVREKLGLLQVNSVSGKQSNDLLTEILTAGRNKGIDVNAWVEARAVLTVFGPMVEAMQRGVSFVDVWEGDGAKEDVRGIVGEGMAAGLSSAEISAVIKRATERVLNYLQQPNVCNAVNTLGSHLHQHGTTSGKRAAAIIRDAMGPVGAGLGNVERTADSTLSRPE